MTDQIFSKQIRAAVLLHQARFQTCDLVGIVAAGKAQFFARDGQRGSQQGLVDDAHRCSRFGDAVDTHIVAIHFGRLAGAGLDGDILCQR